MKRVIFTCLLVLSMSAVSIAPAMAAQGGNPTGSGRAYGQARSTYSRSTTRVGQQQNQGETCGRTGASTAQNTNSNSRCVR